METPYRIAVIGCGSRAHAHVQAYRHLPEASVVACCAPNPVRRDPFASQYNLHAYDDAAHMIREERPDMVHIVTWPSTHLEIMETVAGLDVPLCTLEKPLAVGVSDWKRMSALEKEAKTRFAVCHQFRWQRDLVRVREHLLTAGSVRLVQMSSGMNISGQGTHTLDYGMSLNGDAPVTHVFGQATGWDLEDSGHPAPLGTGAVLKFANGATGLWTTGFMSPRVGNPDAVWQHVRVEVFAEAGQGMYGEFGDWRADSPAGHIAGTFPGMDGWQEENLLAQAAFHRSMLNWLETGRLCGTHLGQSLHEWKVVLALYQSVLEHAVVDMDTFSPADDLPSNLRRLLGG